MILRFIVIKHSFNANDFKIKKTKRFIEGKNVDAYSLISPIFYDILHIQNQMQLFKIKIRKRVEL